MTIPIPPSHCRNDLQISIPFGKLSKLFKVVAPVVVIHSLTQIKHQQYLSLFLYKRMEQNKV